MKNKNSEIPNLTDRIVEIRDSLASLHELYDQNQKDGVSLDDTVFEDYQKNIQREARNLIDDLTDLIARSGQLKNVEGETLRDLPAQVPEKISEEIHTQVPEKISEEIHKKP